MKWIKNNNERKVVIWTLSFRNSFFCQLQSLEDSLEEQFFECLFSPSPHPPSPPPMKIFPSLSRLQPPEKLNRICCQPGHTSVPAEHLSHVTAAFIEMEHPLTFLAYVLCCEDEICFFKAPTARTEKAQRKYPQAKQRNIPFRYCLSKLTPPERVLLIKQLLQSQDHLFAHLCILHITLPFLRCGIQVSRHCSRCGSNRVFCRG